MTPDDWKDRGNKLFAAAQYESAIECYSRAIALQPTAVLYANRAMAQLKLAKYAAADSDCTVAMQLDPGYVKSYHRRGVARRNQKQYLLAAQVRLGSRFNSFYQLLRRMRAAYPVPFAFLPHTCVVAL